MRSFIRHGLLAGFLAISLGAVATAGAPAKKAKPTPTPSAVPTPKPFPKSREAVVFLNQASWMDGFIIFATPAPKSASQEKLSNIDGDCAFARSGASGAFAQTFVPGAQAHPAIPPCQGVYVDAKPFLKLFNAKVKQMEIPQTGFRGDTSFTYCGKDYEQPFYMSKLAGFGGKPTIDPVQTISLINQGVLKKYSVTLVFPTKAQIDAADKAKAPQTPYSLRISGEIPTCKTKKPGTGWIMDVKSSTFGRDATGGGDIREVVTAHLVLRKAGGNVTLYKPVSFDAPTTITYQASGPFSYVSAELHATKCNITSTTPGNASVAMLGNSALAIAFPPMEAPRENITCPMGGTYTQGWWSMMLSVHKADLTAAGGFNGFVPMPSLVLPLTDSVDGTKEFTSSYNGTNEGGKPITEETTITLTPCTTMNCH